MDETSRSTSLSTSSSFELVHESTLFVSCASAVLHLYGIHGCWNARLPFGQDSPAHNEARNVSCLLLSLPLDTASQQPVPFVIDTSGCVPKCARQASSQRCHVKASLRSAKGRQVAQTTVVADTGVCIETDQSLSQFYTPTSCWCICMLCCLQRSQCLKIGIRI